MRKIVLRERKEAQEAVKILGLTVGGSRKEKLPSPPCNLTIFSPFSLFEV